MNWRLFRSIFRWHNEVNSWKTAAVHKWLMIISLALVYSMVIHAVKWRNLWAHASAVTTTTNIVTALIDHRQLRPFIQRAEAQCSCNHGTHNTDYFHAMLCLPIFIKQLRTAILRLLFLPFVQKRRLLLVISTLGSLAITNFVVQEKNQKKICVLN